MLECSHRAISPTICKKLQKSKSRFACCVVTNMYKHAKYIKQEIKSNRGSLIM